VSREAKPTTYERDDMEYETPKLQGPAEYYETPLLLDVALASGSFCITGGSCNSGQ
jgi:hypothetical protein